jgi:AraC family transcriptional regulator of adaptative response / DNA-3-methyladenine glycosylase II
VAAAGTPIPVAAHASELTHAFPRPEKFDAAMLACLRIPKARAATLAALAAAAKDNPRLFDPQRDLEAAVEALRKLPGIGEWTAQYIAMRALAESDAFLAGDVGVLRKMARQGRRPTAAEILARSERWRPWRAYAVMHLWAAEAAVSKRLLSKESSYAVSI